MDVSLISKTDLLCSGQPSGAIAMLLEARHRIIMLGTKWFYKFQ
jgi:hypothetical protein